ncbi:MAG: WD40 repeat domain-containing protein [Candidatus Babeliales bacterium]
MNYKSLVFSCLVLLCLGLAVRKIRSMEEVIMPQEAVEQAASSAVPPLAQLAIQSAVDHIFSTAKTIQDIHALVLQLPYAVQVPLALALVQDDRYTGTAFNKLQLAYHVSKEDQYIQRDQLDALFNEVVKGINPCDFVYKKFEELLPGYDPSVVTLRDERLIKAILRKPDLRLADVHLKQPMLTIQPMPQGAYNEEISPDGSMFAFSMENNTLVVWNIQENKPVSVIKLPDSFAFDAPKAWSPDSSILALADNRGNVYFWHLGAHAQPTVRLKVTGMHPQFHNDNEPDEDDPYIANFLKLSPEDRTLINELEPINWVDAERNVALVYTRQPEQKRGITWFIKRDLNIRPQHFKADDQHALYSMSFSPDGYFLATVSDLGRVRVWDVRNLLYGEQEVLEPMPPLFDHEFGGRTPVAVVLSQNAKRLAIAPIQNEIHVYDVQEGKLIARAMTDSFDTGYVGLGAHALALSADGKYVAFTGEGYYHLFDIDEQASVLYFDRGHISPTQVFSPGQSFKGDGGFVACGLEKEHPLVVYGMRSRGNLNVKFPFKNEFDAPSVFSGDGTYFVSRGLENYNIWQLPVNYLKGNLTWQQLRDVLARACLQVMPAMPAHGAHVEQGRN